MGKVSRTKLQSYRRKCSLALRSIGTPPTCHWVSSLPLSPKVRRHKLRDLKLPALYRGSPWFTTEEDFDEAREIRRTSGRIIAAASAIDQTIAEILLGTIFREVVEHRELVLGSVLNSDWCSFSAKRKMLSIAVEKFDLLHGKKKSQLDACLKRVMQYRNAFAHGHLAHNVEVQELHYYEGGPIIKTLNDSYFEQLERDFLVTWETLEDIVRRVKIKA